MKKSLPLIVVGLVVVALMAVVVKTKLNEEVKEHNLVPTAAPVIQVPTSTPAQEVPAGMKRVQADVDYDSPGGVDKVHFELLVDASGKISQASLVPQASNKQSDQWIQGFAKEFPSVVVGKKLADMTDLDIVARASLTTDAFNQALPSLKKQLL